MAYKIHKRGAFVIIENTVNGELKELNSQFVQITKGKTSLDQYEVLYNGVSQLKAVLGDIQDANGVAYVEADWDIFRYEQCGSVNSSEVANPYPAPTTVEVDIPAGAAGVSGILGMGTNPIELLPAAGVGKYYDIEKVILEYTHVTTAYTLGTATRIRVSDSNGMMFFDADSAQLSEVDNNVSRLTPITVFNNAAGAGGSEITQGYFYTNDSLSLSTISDAGSGVDVTIGDGTLRVIITYTTRTFGA